MQRSDTSLDELDRARVIQPKGSMSFSSDSAGVGRTSAESLLLPHTKQGSFAAACRQEQAFLFMLCPVIFFFF